MEPSDESQAWWRERYPSASVGGELVVAVAGADIVLLAVKPNVIPIVAQQSAGVWDGKLVVSIAAGISLQKLSGWIGHRRVVRVMPNTPSRSALDWVRAAVWSAREQVPFVVAKTLATKTCCKSNRCSVASVLPFASKSLRWTL